MANTFKDEIARAQEYKALEALGQALAAEQSLEMLDLFANGWRDELWKLSPLLVGMQRSIFEEMVMRADQRQLQILRKEVIAEPIQHHLTLLTHDFHKQIETFTQELQKFELNLSQLQVEELNHKDVMALTHAIQTGGDFYSEMSSKLDTLLALAWNTRREDLIEKLSHAKESCQRVQVHYVGRARSTTQSATGLFALLEQRLNSVYGDSREDIEAVNDDEPALEALVKLSIWYLHDYWQVGLLPHIKDPLLVEMSNAFSTEQRREMMEKLLDRTRQNLGRLGLHSAKDLKKAGIFSKKTLEEYVQQHRYLLEKLNA